MIQWSCLHSTISANAQHDKNMKFVYIKLYINGKKICSKLL